MLKIIHTYIRTVQQLSQTALIAIIARIGLAATFWLSGQTKIEGFQFDLFGEQPLQLGVPSLTEGVVALFRDEYRLPFLEPELAATIAATAEHMLPLLLILGLATRLSALGLLTMTMVIQIFVYPDAWTVHTLWISAQLYLLVYGAGSVSLDRLISRRY
ncbi:MULTISPECIES: DoxX family protein [Enterobacter]|uniref:DoxX family protein n=1 Tax=Enterobacter TaxID=547 RepID=UPI001CBFD42B|nr:MULTISPECIES: DoxX family protein [Enterobacter]UAN18815.1 DoxX family protein [Enterobacter asburiae]UAN34156.1 DoxX family protein [Enterobacter sp. JBIWA005]